MHLLCDNEGSECLKKIETVSKETARWFSELFSAHYPFMMRKALLYAKNRQDAEDIVSESCIGIIRQHEKLSKLSEQETLQYISVCIRHTACRYMKYWSQLKTAISAGEHKDIDMKLPEDVLIRMEHLDCVSMAIDKLSEHEQFALRLKVLEGMSDQEIADQLNLAVSSVRKYVQRARLHLCEIIEKEDE